MADMMCSAVEAHDTIPCAQCGAAFHKRTERQIYCSRPCKWASLRRTKVASACEKCGGQFFPLRPGGKSVSRGTRNGVFCSRACHFAAQVVEKVKSEPIPKQCLECGGSFVSSHGKFCSTACGKENARVRAFNTNAARKPMRARPCKECRLIFVPEYGNKRRFFCSYACARKNKRRDSPSQPRKRARAAGVSYEPINPIRVLERDGWRCQICGEKTPKRLRGKQAPRSPEIDHRVPLAMGGGHTWDNVQCACRECNAAKAASRVVGQMNLFPVVAARRACPPSGLRGF